MGEDIGALAAIRREPVEMLEALKLGRPFSPSRPVEPEEAPWPVQSVEPEEAPWSVQPVEPEEAPWPVQPVKAAQRRPIMPEPMKPSEGVQVKSPKNATCPVVAV